MLDRDGSCNLPKALTGNFRDPTDEEMTGAIEALEAVIGTAEAARQSWRRRLVVAPDGFRLAVNEAGFLSNGDLPQFTPGSTTAIPVALPIDAAVELLKSKSNPELELERRRTFLAELNRRHQQQAEDERNQRLAAAKRQADAAERAKTYRWDDFAKLVDWQRAFYTLAIAIDEGEALGSALRRIAGSVQAFNGERATPLPGPSKPWW